nr:keratinocyte proline-rich protein-like [Aegilops tauschii subsp. strangulata]
MNRDQCFVYISKPCENFRSVPHSLAANAALCPIARARRRRPHRRPCPAPSRLHRRAPPRAVAVTSPHRPNTVAARLLKFAAADALDAICPDAGAALRAPLRPPSTPSAPTLALRSPRPCARPDAARRPPAPLVSTCLAPLPCPAPATPPCLPHPRPCPAPPPRRRHAPLPGP